MAIEGAGPFGTFLIVGPTCFFLGMLFQNFPYDYFILWASPPEASQTAQYFNINEEHLRFLHASPPIISRILHIVIGVGVLGFLMKLYKPSEANKLFDGASLVLYMCGIVVYSSNIVKGMRAVTGGIYGDKTLAKGESLWDKSTEGVEDQYIGREDSLRVIAASHTILAFILVGILMLQAGQWYAQRKEVQEMEQLERTESERRKEKTSKKKQ